MRRFQITEVSNGSTLLRVGAVIKAPWHEENELTIVGFSSSNAAYDDFLLVTCQDSLGKLSYVSPKDIKHIK